MNNIVFGVSGFLSCSRPHFPPSSTVRVNESLLRRGHFSSVSHLRSLTLSKKSLVRKRSGKELEKVLRDHITQSVSLLRFLHDSYLQRALLTQESSSVTLLLHWRGSSFSFSLLYVLRRLCFRRLISSQHLLHPTVSLESITFGVKRSAWISFIAFFLLVASIPPKTSYPRQSFS